MVERIEAQGVEFDDMSSRLGIQSRQDYRLLWFSDHQKAYYHVSKIPQILDRLAFYPQFDEGSFLISRVLDRKMRTADVLAVPAACPDLLIDDLSGEIPNEEETYIVMTYRRNGNGRPLEILVLSDNYDRAEQIARHKTSKLINCNEFDVEAEAIKITPEEWVSTAREQISRGFRLDPWKLRFADLRECQRRFDEEGRL